VAVSTASDLVTKFGIHPANMFIFWDWVGGRYSMDSAIGLSTMLAIGPAAFGEMLAGFHEMDRHFLEAPAERNLPVLMGLLQVWNTTLMGFGAHAVLPYCQHLHRFAAYLQQLEMESNGKHVQLDGSPTEWDTCPVIWGEPGTNGQHAFFQMLHQGTIIVPADFIAFAEPNVDSLGMHDMLFANAIAQARVMAFGQTPEELRAQGTPAALIMPKEMDGNRPTTFLLCRKRTPRALGRLADSPVVQSDVARREADLFARLPGVVAKALAATGWARHLGDLDGAPIASRAALARLPILRKSELPALQQADPPFGGLLGAPATAPCTWRRPTTCPPTATWPRTSRTPSRRRPSSGPTRTTGSLSTGGTCPLTPPCPRTRWPRWWPP
jgi:glucose-6-phosphate isomerase